MIVHLIRDLILARAGVNSWRPVLSGSKRRRCRWLTFTRLRGFLLLFRGSFRAGGEAGWRLECLRESGASGRTTHTRVSSVLHVSSAWLWLDVFCPLVNSKTGVTAVQGYCGGCHCMFAAPAGIVCLLRWLELYVVCRRVYSTLFFPGTLWLLFLLLFSYFLYILYRFQRSIYTAMHICTSIWGIYNHHN